MVALPRRFEGLRRREAAGAATASPPRARVIANPGSVGQPRDQVPRASYFIFDMERQLLEQHRVGFDVASVQSDVRSAGYPEVLATRLAAGR